MYSMDNDIDHILVSEDALKAKVNELGAQISRDYAGKDLLLVSILKGSVVFMADLMRAVEIPCAIDFMVVSSYGGANTSSTGLVKIIKDLDADLTGRDVLIVEDILDTGITLSKLVPVLKMRNPGSVKICTVPVGYGDGLRRVAMAITAKTNAPCCTLGPGGQGLAYALAAAPGGDVREPCKALNAAYQGRGGGKPGFCQGSLAEGSFEQVKAFLLKSLLLREKVAEAPTEAG